MHICADYVPFIQECNSTGQTPRPAYQISANTGEIREPRQVSANRCESSPYFTNSDLYRRRPLCGLSMVSLPKKVLLPFNCLFRGIISVNRKNTLFSMKVFRLTDVLSIKDNGLYPQSEEMLRSVILKLCRAPKLPHMKNATLIHEVQPR
jgi:hypothetical protein